MVDPMNYVPRRIHRSGHLNSCIYDRPLFGLRKNFEGKIGDQLEWMSTWSCYMSVQIPVYMRAVPASTSKHMRVPSVHPQTNES
jgi:hypothetical protein